MSNPVGDGDRGQREGWMGKRRFFMHRFEEPTLALLRVVSGLMLMQHGVQKLFGELGGWRGTPGATAPPARPP